MYINYGDNLFMPEGDDYSKQEFDKDAEEIALKGNVVLQELRMQQAADQALRAETVQEKVSKPAENHKKEQKKLSYKEIFDQMKESKKSK
ncbi:hypothetical protein [Aminipila terrae]|uniref:Uncharacterized protein n=1 Tax=Aminipila terrae TaxID=2697030 RepID=A0A6P1MFK9_9FIRM|nr:hypothetical protein [Aminipila terrae]QHI72531.1 hypothetical protein Ami3637_09090 [Aminipila terrae]